MAGKTLGERLAKQRADAEARARKYFPDIPAAPVPNPYVPRGVKSVVGGAEDSAAGLVAPSEVPSAKPLTSIAPLNPNIRLPVKWGDVPSKAKWEDEVEWVHQNRILVVGETSAGLIRMDWTHAKTPAPSMGAVALMQDAAANPQWFSRDILAKTKKGGEESGGDLVREDRKRVEEVRRLLGQFVERAREEARVLLEGGG